jgi:glycosyltransferase involved in cell wall biosynthesis
VTALEQDMALTWTFVVPTGERPTGGDLATFEIANALARTGRHLVQIVHVPLLGARVRDLAELPWFDFDPAVVHRFHPDHDPDRLPPADVVLHSTKLLAVLLDPTAGEAGPRLLDALRGAAARSSLTIRLLQGRGVFSPSIEDLALSLPGPKVCVGSWLAEQARAQGVPAADVLHIPNGIDPGRFGIVRPIEGRLPRVALHFDPHPVKGGVPGIAALRRVHADLAVPGIVFGARPPDRPLGKGLTLMRSPGQATIAAEIYNRSSLFLQSSVREGFGMCAVEAMACGCALVTTDNGGSADYAVDGETALVCGAEADEMAEALGRLVRDDDLRVRIATEGSRYVERFRWSTTADRLAGVATDRIRSSRR